MTDIELAIMRLEAAKVAFELERMLPQSLMSGSKALDLAGDIFDFLTGADEVSGDADCLFGEPDAICRCPLCYADPPGSPPTMAHETVVNYMAALKRHETEKADADVRSHSPAATDAAGHWLPYDFDCGVITVGADGAAQWHVERTNPGSQRYETGQAY